MKIIGVTGLARSGKDTFCNIVSHILSKKGFKVKRYAFADTLKSEVAPFLKDICNVDVWTDDTEVKNDIRDFLVWYGTKFWRKRQPDRWIRNVENQFIKDESNIDIGIVTDVRYPNEAHWVHSKNGFLVHVSKYRKISADAGKTWTRKFSEPPNLEESQNDPILNNLSDSKIIWEDLCNNEGYKININELIHNTYLQEEVIKCLQLCPFLPQLLKNV
jgi:hypothetical protein